MRHPTRRPAPLPAVVAALAIALTAFAAPALAKEGLDAQLEAPIARDTPGGTTLLLGVWVTMTDETGTHDVEGSPVYVRLTGPDGASSSAVASQSRAGHYTVRVTVPESGVEAVEVGMRGTTDLPFNLVGFTIVKGPISAKTAQASPAITPGSAPEARASVPAPRPVPPVAPVVEATTIAAPVAAPAEPGPAPLIVGAVALVAASLATLAIVRRLRIAAHPRLSGRSPGA
jgi:hypothetical protein